MSLTPLRGQVFRVELGHGAKPWLVVSNNARNRNLETVLAARIPTTSKHSTAPTVVALSSADPLVGYVVVDDIVHEGANIERYGPRLACLVSENLGYDAGADQDNGSGT